MVSNLSLSKTAPARDVFPRECHRVSGRVTAWLYLALAIASEVLGLTIMKWTPVIGQMVGLTALYSLLALSYFFLSIAVQSIPVGIAYTVWEAAGVASLTILSWLLFEQPLSSAKFTGLMLALFGIVLIRWGEPAND
jgi:spermidine export protein MdtJ